MTLINHQVVRIIIKSFQQQMMANLVEKDAATNNYKCIRAINL
jgi:hypothetical protein